MRQDYGVGRKRGQKAMQESRRSAVEAELSKATRRKSNGDTGGERFGDCEDANDDEERIGCSYPRAMRSGCTQNQHQSQPI
ncbi:hypothetical protein FOIG_02175 [Fusarium odoratissimum NRRL 54006]|nr:uncharacterized protein FOIG_02175 [Fusarium odoratissimum NRRL 54006]EXM09306.1 hypothetical protein FOIG_02175 [Fusarium odoratissimum NRRL 54006]TXC06539.1 hypothetical protein FocTR4_00010058 [Fusarium oxysporum f. sp. cubense]